MIQEREGNKLPHKIMLLDNHKLRVVVGEWFLVVSSMNSCEWFGEEAWVWGLKLTLEPMTDKKALLRFLAV